MQVQAGKSQLLNHSSRGTHIRRTQCSKESGVLSHCARNPDYERIPDTMNCVLLGAVRNQVGDVAGVWRV